MEQVASHWTDFHEIWYLNIFRKSVQKIQVSLKSDKDKGYFTWRPIYISDPIISRSWPLKMGPIDCPGTSVWNYHYLLRNSPEKRSSYLLRGGTLKSRSRCSYTCVQALKYSVKSLVRLTKIINSRRISVKFPNVKFYEKSIRRLSSYRRRTERHDETVGEFLYLSVPDSLKVLCTPAVQGSSRSSSSNSDNNNTVMRQWHGLGGQSLSSYNGGNGSIPDQFVWDLWWTQ
jgi:hypothetical protein